MKRGPNLQLKNLINRTLTEARLPKRLRVYAASKAEGDALMKDRLAGKHYFAAEPHEIQQFRYIGSHSDKHGTTHLWSNYNPDEYDEDDNHDVGIHISPEGDHYGYENIGADPATWAFHPSSTTNVQKAHDAVQGHVWNHIWDQDDITASDRNTIRLHDFMTKNNKE